MSKNLHPEHPEVSFSEEGGIRYLHLGTPWVQGSMIVKEPFELELDYVQRMMAWLLFADLGKLKTLHVMQLGLGAASLTKFCYKQLKCQVTAIEINPQVVTACRGWFKLPADDARLSVVLADAGKEVAKPERLGTVDALQVDLYDHDAAGPVLDSAAFYKHCRNILTDQGCMTVNLFGRMSSFEQSVEKICKVFGPGNVWAFNPTREGNSIVLAHRDISSTPMGVWASQPKQSRDERVRHAEAIYAKFDLPAHKWLRVFKPVV